MKPLLFDDEHRTTQKMLSDFAAKEVKPSAAKRDEEEYFDRDIFRKMGDNGITGIPWPEAYGGSGMDYTTFINAIEEMSKVCGATGSDLAIHTALASWPIYTFGTEEQKHRFLTKLASGEALGSFGLTEPAHGSDYTTLNTRATKTEDGYVLNGSKAFISNAGPSGIYIILAMTEDASKKEDHGLSAFIVEKGTEGFTIGKPEKKMGIRGHNVAALTFDDCYIPKDHLLGEEGSGYMIAKRTLQGGRLAMSAQALGLAKGAYETAKAYVQERKQFGQRLSDIQTIRFKLADMAMDLEASRLMVYQAASLMDEGMEYGQQSAMCKAYVTEKAMTITTDAVQLLGGYGYTRDYPVERMMRDVKITQIYTGTVEMQRIEIAANIVDNE